MTRLARVVFVVLVGATFAAFFLAQRVKGSPPAVDVRGLAPAFSPNGDGRADVEDFTITLRKRDEVTVAVVDGAGDEVRRLATGVPVAAHQPLRLAWNGAEDDGSRAPDGQYRLSVRLRRENRFVLVPKPIALDTVAPRPVVSSVRPPVTGPNPEAVAFQVSGVNPRRRTAVRVLRTDGARPTVMARFLLAPGVTGGRWDGCVRASHPSQAGCAAGGAAASPGTYLLQVAVRDPAGNVGQTPAELPTAGERVPGHAGITVRRLAVQPPLTPVRAGTRGQFFVDARRRAFRWSLRRVGRARLLARGRGAAGAARVAVKIPGSAPSGAYLFQVAAREDSTRVPFAVQGERAAPVLVVLPAITWVGSEPVDDDGDGVPNTLARGDAVRYPRVFAGGDGLPVGFADGVAPLLVTLDRARVRYDLTTDLALARDPSPLDRRHTGVLLAGPLRWVPTPLARRLARYAEAGGRVASFGVGTLRRGVTVAPTQLTRPTQPTALDPFGARLLPVRRLPAGSVLDAVAEDEKLGLFTGTVPPLAGFRAAEESEPPSGGSRMRVRAALAPVASASAEAALDAPPALTASDVGRGLVIRVGLPDWPARLAQDSAVAQITLNVADLLRGAQPRIRFAR